MLSSPSLITDAMATTKSPLMTTAGLSLVNARACSSSVTLRTASSVWTQPIEMETVSHATFSFTRMIKIVVKRGSWSENNLQFKCWLISARFTTGTSGRWILPRPFFLGLFFQFFIFLQCSEFTGKLEIFSFVWLGIITLVWWRSKNNFGACCGWLKGTYITASFSFFLIITLLNQYCT